MKLWPSLAMVGVTALLVEGAATTSDGPFVTAVYVAGAFSWAWLTLEFVLLADVVRK